MRFICSKYRKIEKHKTSYHLGKILIIILSVVSVKIKIKKYLIYQEFRLKKIDEIRSYLTEERNQKELIVRSVKTFVEFWIMLNTRLLKFIQSLYVFPFPLLLLWLEFV